MASNRRDFIRFVVAGSVAGACPLVAVPDPAPSIDGEHNEICHQVRDGHHFARPPISARHDVIIAGGGISGLTAAYLLRGRDFLLLEKEPHWGGNAYLEEREGQAFATGAAFTELRDSPAAELCHEIGIEVLPIENYDPTIVNGEFVADTWGEGLDHLPYPAGVRESFKKFRQSMLAIDLEKRGHEMDSVALAELLAGYAPQLKLWWDTYGPSNWGARSEETSALVALEDFQGFAGEDRHDLRGTFPGGLGAISRKLSSMLESRREHMVTEATIVAVEPQPREVHVTWMQNGQLHAAAAKAVIMATPKFITRRLVAGIPAAQQEAMKRMRYIPYPVVNLVFDKPVYNRGYDTWCPGNTFTDFIVADWVVRNHPGYKQKANILTCYTPLRENERARLLTEDGCREIATAVLHDFQRLLPGLDASPVEVHLYRRGHPMFMATPRTYTQVMPAARKPMERVFFANTDSEGPESLTAGAIKAAQRCVRELGTRL